MLESLQPLAYRCQAGHRWVLEPTNTTLFKVECSESNKTNDSFNLPERRAQWDRWHPATLHGPTVAPYAIHPFSHPTKSSPLDLNARKIKSISIVSANGKNSTKRKKKFQKCYSSINHKRFSSVGHGHRLWPGLSSRACQLDCLHR